MQRTTNTFDDDLTARLDEFTAERAYANRSEAMRDLVPRRHLHVGKR